MKAEFTAIIEAAPEGGYWAICPEVSGANGQGETVEEATENLRHAIELILEDPEGGRPSRFTGGRHSIESSDWMKRRDLERRLRMAGC